MSSNVPAGSPGSSVVCFRLQGFYLKALVSFFQSCIQVYKNQGSFVNSNRWVHIPEAKVPPA